MGYILQERFGTCAKHPIKYLYVFTLVHLCIHLKTDGAKTSLKKPAKKVCCRKQGATKRIWDG